MPTLEKIACMQFRRDEVPNQKLAKELVRNKDKKGIQEIAENIWNRDKNVAFDCIKVLYEIGYLEPKFISQYTNDCIKLLSSKHNRMIWGAMLTLSTVANIRAGLIFKHVKEIKETTKCGSVITQDNGIGTLAIVASKNNRYRINIFPFLLNHLETCRPQSLPQHSEKSFVAIDAKNKSLFINVLNKRLDSLTPSQSKRVEKVIKLAEAL